MTTTLAASLAHLQDATEGDHPASPWAVAKAVQGALMALGYAAPLTYHEDPTQWRVTLDTREAGRVAFKPTPGLVEHVRQYYTPETSRKAWVEK